MSSSFFNHIVLPKEIAAVWAPNPQEAARGQYSISNEHVSVSVIADQVKRCHLHDNTNTDTDTDTEVPDHDRDQDQTQEHDEGQHVFSFDKLSLVEKQQLHNLEQGIAPKAKKKAN